MLKHHSGALMNLRFAPLGLFLGYTVVGIPDIVLHRFG
jgi:hypothetical protein